MRTKIVSLTIGLLMVGCASARVCPSVGNEAISLCRAEAACGKGSAGNIIGTIFGNVGGGENSAVRNYNNCIDRNLIAQRINSGVQSTSVRCVSTRLATDQVETRCE